jgi:hypothetical protein
VPVVLGLLGSRVVSRDLTSELREIDRAEFTSGANAVSATNVNDARRSERKE